MLAVAQPARRRDLFVAGDPGRKRRREAVCGLAEGFGLVSAVGQRLRQIGEMDDKAAIFVSLQTGRIAEKRSSHRRIGLLIEVTRADAELSQHGAQQTGADLLATILERRSARTEIEGRMAALTFELVEPYRDPALAAKFPQPAQQLVSGHDQYHTTLL